VDDAPLVPGTHGDEEARSASSSPFSGFLDAR